MGASSGRTWARRALAAAAGLTLLYLAFEAGRWAAGYSIVEAKDLAAARALLAGHPHLADPKHSIDILEITPIAMKLSRCGEPPASARLSPA